MNQEQQSKNNLRKKLHRSIAYLAYFAKGAGPRYWKLKPDPERNLPPAVIAIVGNEEEIQAAANLTESIYQQQMERFEAGDRDNYLDAAFGPNDSAE